MDESLYEIISNMILSPGDLIVDELTGFVGILIKRERRIDMFDDDVYFWHIKWIKNINKSHDPTEVPHANILEEEGLKLSIVVEMISHYPADKSEQDF